MLAPATQCLSDVAVATELAKLSGWMREGDAISKHYKFTNYHETMAFVNATAWISHREDHHPEIVLGYNQCKVVYTSHSANGISINDFICAAKVEALLTL